MYEKMQKKETKGYLWSYLCTYFSRKGKNYLPARLSAYCQTEG